MRFFIISIALVLVFTACSRPRLISELEPLEKEQLNSVLFKRKRCLIQNIQRMDNNVMEVNKLAELVVWKCREYPEQVRYLLYEGFGVEVGDAWIYGDQLEASAEKEATEAILEQRRIYKNNNPEDRLLRAPLE